MPSLERPSGPESSAGSWVALLCHRGKQNACRWFLSLRRDHIHCGSGCRARRRLSLHRLSGSHRFRVPRLRSCSHRQLRLERGADALPQGGRERRQERTSVLPSVRYTCLLHCAGGRHASHASRRHVESTNRPAPLAADLEAFILAMGRGSRFCGKLPGARSLVSTLGRRVARDRTTADAPSRTGLTSVRLQMPIDPQDQPLIHAPFF